MSDDPVIQVLEDDDAVTLVSVQEKVGQVQVLQLESDQGPRVREFVSSESQIADSDLLTVGDEQTLLERKQLSLLLNLCVKLLRARITVESQVVHCQRAQGAPVESDETG